jgi:hypothetical protein
MVKSVIPIALYKVLAGKNQNDDNIKIKGCQSQINQSPISKAAAHSLACGYSDSYPALA